MQEPRQPLRQYVLRVLLMSNDPQNLSVLIGNSFPLSLIRRRAMIEPKALAELQQRLRAAIAMSFWGHRNTLKPASALLGVDLTPVGERPVLTLDKAGLPVFEGKAFPECWVLSPDYTPGYRPAVGEEVAMDKIIGWQVLLITFPEVNP